MNTTTDNLTPQTRHSPPLPSNPIPLSPEVWGEEPPGDRPIHKVSPAEQHRFSIARGVLAGYAVLLVTAAASHMYLGTPAAAEVWGFMSATMLPVIALIIGYYFNSKK